jgi:outer membrane receptor protein involved in Fe transport
MTTAEFLFATKQDMLAAGDKSDNRIPTGGTPGWQVINLLAGYQLPSVKFNIGIQNILNEDYRTHGSGINGVGRSAWASVEWVF